MAIDPAAQEVIGCVGPSGSAIGMPQLCGDWMPNQIFWLVVTLIVLYLVLSRVVLPRIGAVLAERSGTITNDLGAAEELKQRSSDAEAAYDKALVDARGEADRIVAEKKAEIQTDLDAELAKADAEIAARTAESEAAIGEIRDSAMQSVAEVAKDTAGEIVTAMGGTADRARVEAAVDARMGDSA